ncbi:hypothetical protein THF1C08_80024 [Vibrio jasicida]|uniref:Uncharacterized protein n=1 Tax=Vibrio jasicida TaxID=766224 RepID=A0AAU9R036_9VIBR|nr:hypothetical protein THF1C08_80024 [Vibrio jasicida]CAH1603301.1 hypothetical protein THF1A12_70024 [Vibrio jasicida]
MLTFAKRSQYTWQLDYHRDNYCIYQRLFMQFIPNEIPIKSSG